MKAAEDWVIEPIEGEFAEAELGDPRRSRRLEMIAGSLAERPDVGFPQAFSTDAELEAFYRFVGNDDVDAQAVLAPHVEATLERASAARDVVVIHDTTTFKFGGESRRQGLGHTASKAQGFFGHVALAVAADEARTPLGVVGLHTFVRLKNQKRKMRKKGDPDYEYGRWTQLMDRVEDLRGDDFACVHVMDREADFYDLFEAAVSRGARFVIRVGKERRIERDDFNERVEHMALHIKPRCKRKTTLSTRGSGLNPTMRKAHPPRDERQTTLSVGGFAVRLGPSRGRTKNMKLNLVRVWEPDPPKGEEPVQWLLLTTEPVATATDLKRIVDIYRTRWMIEEYFKALKSGCSIEKRQLESYEALQVALAVFLPIAWRLLFIRTVARTSPKTKASKVLTPIQLAIVQHKTGKDTAKMTAEEALYAIARFGGHLKRNGPPGWQTLGRGYQELLIMEVGFRAAVKMTKEGDKDVINH